MKPSLKTGLILVVVAALGMGGVALAQIGDDDVPPMADRPGYRRILERLTDLVDQGVIDQGQAQAVAEHLVSTGGFGPRPGRPGGPGPGPGDRLVEEAAEILNMSVDDLHRQLAGGATPADIAGAQTDALIAKLVDALESDIAAAFEEGAITEIRRDHLLETVTERVTRFVEGGPRVGPHFGGRGPAPGPHGGPRFGGPGAGGPGFGPCATAPHWDIEPDRAYRP